MKRALFPMTARERDDAVAAARAALSADPPPPIWIVTPGGAAMQVRLPFPNPRNHAEEIANARAEHEARRA